jgi:hypothetical protein
MSPTFGNTPGFRGSPGEMNIERTIVHFKPLLALAAISLTGAVLLAGCGSSSKPAYCTQVTNFENSVKTLEQVEVSPSNISTITADVQKVGSRAKELESAVRTEFASQISSMKTSAGALEATLRELVSAPGSATIAHAVSVVPAEIEGLKHSAAEIQEVTKSKCK